MHTRDWIVGGALVLTALSRSILRRFGFVTRRDVDAARGITWTLPVIVWIVAGICNVLGEWAGVTWHYRRIPTLGPPRHLHDIWWHLPLWIIVPMVLDQWDLLRRRRRLRGVN